MYLGYCMDRFGRYPAPVQLADPSEVFHYCQLQKTFQYEVRIVDPSDDAIIVQVIQGEYVHPEEWKKFN